VGLRSGSFGHSSRFELVFSCLVPRIDLGVRRPLITVSGWIGDVCDVISQSAHRYALSAKLLPPEALAICRQLLGV
jgi:hypothetical protein